MQLNRNSHESDCGNELTQPEMAAIAGLINANARLTQALGQRLQEQHDLLLSEYEILHAISESEKQCARLLDLAGSAHLSISGMSRLAVRLEERGIVDRVPNQKDGRSSQLKLTPVGEELLAHARETHKECAQELILQHLTDEEIGQLVAIWGKIADGSGCGATVE